MEIKELRIGNWVINNYLKPDYETNKDPIGWNYYKIECGGDIEDYEDYEPIPLTEEILLKCGFEKLGLIKYELNGVVLNIKWSSYFIHRFDTEIKHLHQLQNLYFALKGEELKIKL